MTATKKIDAMQWLRNQIEEAPSGLRDALAESVKALMNAEADALCGAEYGERSDERVNQRNGYRMRDWDTRLGTIELPVPKLRSGSYFPSWLLRPRRRAEQALTAGLTETERRRLAELLRKLLLSVDEAT